MNHLLMICGGRGVPRSVSCFRDADRRAEAGVGRPPFERSHRRRVHFRPFGRLKLRSQYPTPSQSPDRESTEALIMKKILEEGLWKWFLPTGSLSETHTPEQRENGRKPGAGFTIFIVRTRREEWLARLLLRGGE